MALALMEDQSVQVGLDQIGLMECDDLRAGGVDPRNELRVLHDDHLTFACPGSELGRVPDGADGLLRGEANLLIENDEVDAGTIGGLKKLRERNDHG